MDAKTRNDIEKRIFEHCVKELLESPRMFSLHLSDGEEIVVEDSRDAKEIVEAAFSTDGDDLYVTYTSEGKKGRGYIRFIYGNSGWDVINDYSVWLEPHIEETLALAESLEM